MQNHLPRVLYPSQQGLSSNEVDIPSFEDAFDPDSLRKFFNQKNPSSFDTPLTSCANGSFSEHPALSQGSKSIFGSPLSFYTQRDLEKAHVSMVSDTPEGFSFKTHDLFGQSSCDIKDWIGEGESTRQGIVQRIVSNDNRMEESKMEIINGGNRITINLAGKTPVKGPPQESLEYKELGSLKIFDQATSENLITETKGDKFSIEREKTKKSVFTIEKSVTPKVISKVEKVKRKPSTLAKAKIEGSEEQLEELDTRKKAEDECDVDSSQKEEAKKVQKRKTKKPIQQKGEDI